MNNLKECRVGKTNKNNSGENMEIIEYFSAHKIKIKFESGCTMTTNYASFKKGEVRNPDFKNGKLGNTRIVSGKNVTKPSYNKWRDMMTRCYGKNQKRAYDDCAVCEEWKTYENFEKWYDKNYYKCGEEKITLDKDILIKGNKLYSPETCVFVPHVINSSFTTCKDRRGKLPIGVCQYRDGRYTTSINKHGRQHWIGYFKTPEDAFYAYKETKEEYIRQIADEYRVKYPDFSEKLYNAMYEWEVKIDD